LESANSSTSKTVWINEGGREIGVKPSRSEKKRIVWLILILFLIPAPAAAERWSPEVLGGSAYHARTPLTIDQTGEEEIDRREGFSTGAMI